MKIDINNYDEKHHEKIKARFNPKSDIFEVEGLNKNYCFFSSLRNPRRMSTDQLIAKKNASLIYHKKHRVTKSLTLGIVTCPKCKAIGKASWITIFNTKLDTKTIHTRVRHQLCDKKSKSCYIKGHIGSVEYKE